MPGGVTLIKLICGVVFVVGFGCLWRLTLLARLDFLPNPVPVIEQKTRLALAWRWVGYFAAVIAVLVVFASLNRSTPTDPEPAPQTPATIMPRE